MKPSVLAVGVVLVSSASTPIVLRIRREETQRRAKPAFTVALLVFNLLVYGLLATLVP